MEVLIFFRVLKANIKGFLEALDPNFTCTRCDALCF